MSNTGMPGDPLARYRSDWDIQTRRDNIPVWSALRRSGSSVIYLVALTREGLARKLERVTSDGC